MFHASAIFGRSPGTQLDKPDARLNIESSKRPAPKGLVNRTWDPATGRLMEEDIPEDIQEMMGVTKKAKLEQQNPIAAEAWGGAKPQKAKVLGPSTLGLIAKGAAPAAQIRAAGPAGQIDRNSPSVEYHGFSKVDLDNRYYERANVVVHGRPSYWSTDGEFFIYWQGELNRWSICDAASFAAVKAGQLPGWAYKENNKPLSQASGWMEAWNGEWKQPDLEVKFYSAAHHKPCWQDPVAQKFVTQVEFRGFAMKELNTVYHLKANEMIQGKASFWDRSGVYFLYWQESMSRWALCDLKCLDAVRNGSCPGWAYREDSEHFANACGWQEMRLNQWVTANIETVVGNTSSRGLKFRLSGFSRQDLNSMYKERADEEIQGKPTYWDASGSYFIYWQESMKRWAILDSASLHMAKAGLAPGWAYRTDSEHFARSCGWMESCGKDWKEVVVCCTIHEGVVQEKSTMRVKTEVQGEDGADISAQQYRSLVNQVYKIINPSKCRDLDAIYAKFAGREGELFSQICEKYEVNLDDICTKLPHMRKLIQEFFPTVGSIDDGEDAYAYLENEDLPEMKASEYAILVQAIYVQHNPKKLQDIGRLLVKYKTKERELYMEACKKYGEHPAKFYAMYQGNQGAAELVAEPV